MMNADHGATRLTETQRSALNIVFEWMIVLCIIIFFGWSCWEIASIINEWDDAREFGWKEDCVARGGSVTEHIGGMTRFDCVSPKTFKKTSP
jgi:hypothetical protein